MDGPPALRYPFLEKEVAELDELERQMRVLASGTDELLPQGGLEEKLRRSLEEGRPLRVKFGVDPTRPDLHLGHAVPLRKLRQFQDLGHQVILLIGDFTARVGDPSARDVTRPQLTREEVEENARTYTEQAFRILDPERITIDHNSRWLASLTFEDLLGLTSHFTVARLLERDDFQRRYQGNVPICLHEFLYPVMQAYDSVALQADVEIGGTDQKFNLLAGRELQRSLGQEPQCVMTLPILVGLDGCKKMSKSLGNHVGLTDPPDEMFGKLMSLPDGLMPDYLRLTTALEPETVEAWLGEWESGALHPAELKRRLAGSVVELYWGREAAAAARERFDRVFSEREAPEEMPVFRLREDMLVDGSILLARLAALAGLCPSVSDARRSIRQGGLRLNGEKVDDEDLVLGPAELDGAVLQRGKRAFARIEVA
jgi:tyrosyl-tRNA synthetase